MAVGSLVPSLCFIAYYPYACIPLYCILYLYFSKLQQSNQACISLKYVFEPVVKHFILHDVTACYSYSCKTMVAGSEKWEKKKTNKLALEIQSIREIAFTAKSSRTKLQASLKNLGQSESSCSKSRSWSFASSIQSLWSVKENGSSRLQWYTVTEHTMF